MGADLQLASGNRIDIMVAIQWGVVIGASLAAAIYDVRERRIPNAITGPLAAGGLVFALLAGGLLGLAGAVGACALLALPYVLLFLFGKGGAGDAKLMGAIGAWVGLADGVAVLFCVAIVGGFLGIAKIVSQGRMGFVLINALVWLYMLMRFIIRCITRRKADAVVQSRTLASDDAAESYASQYGYAQRLTGLNIPYGVAIFVGVCIAGGYVLLCK